MGEKEGQRGRAAETPTSAPRGRYLICELCDLQVVGLGLQRSEQSCLVLQPGPQLPTEAMEATQGYCPLQPCPVVLRRGRPRGGGEVSFPIGPSEWSCHPSGQNVLF